MSNKKISKPILLCILDGWGIGDKNDPHNAIAAANTANYDRFLANYPNSQLQTSGRSVGLPEGQIGNSEVGHMTIGAGRVIFQDLEKINNSIKDGSLAQDPKLQNLINDLKNSKKTCHLAGLFSDGGVHSHIDHIIFLANLLVENGVKTVIHAFLDGRDVAQRSALQYFQQSSNLNIATISGRYFAMDRDQNWDRVQLASNAMINGEGENFSDFTKAINNSYENDISDEFIKPCVIGNYSGIEADDALIFCNFRADRARQISQELAKNCQFSHALALTQYSQELNNFYQILFPSDIIKNSLPEILQDNNLKQLRIAETEKYAHVTFFFSGGEEQEFKNEKRILVKSPAVATYDLQPEMSSAEVGKKLRQAIDSDEFDFIVVNYANPDMVGHSGMFEPALKACEAIDNQLGLLEKIILEKNGTMLITADHGNIEAMLDQNNKPHTAHTTNPVPFIAIANDLEKIKLKNGSLSDIAPTILQLLQIKQPSEMNGEALIENY